MNMIQIPLGRIANSAEVVVEIRPIVTLQSPDISWTPFVIPIFSLFVSQVRFVRTHGRGVCVITSGLFFPPPISIILEGRLGFSNPLSATR
jgi:hypothetical protein